MASNEQIIYTPDMDEKKETVNEKEDPIELTEEEVLEFNKKIIENYGFNRISLILVRCLSTMINKISEKILIPETEINSEFVSNISEIETYLDIIKSGFDIPEETVHEYKNYIYTEFYKILKNENTTKEENEEEKNELEQ